MANTEKKPVFKKNKPGRRIRSLSPYTAMTSFIMKDRCDALNYFQDSIEITEVEKFLRQKRDEGLKGIGFLHMFIAAYVRTVSQKPVLNRYICGQRQFAAKDIIVVMTIKKTMSADAEDTTIKVKFDPRDTLTDVYNKMNDAIMKVKEGNDTATDGLARLVIKLPRFILTSFVKFVMFLDYHNIMPRFIYDASPFHGSMIITDMGSLGIPPIYHHIYNFGTLPVFISFGIKRRAYEMNKNGEVEAKRYIDFNVVVDERTTDGYNYAQCLKMMRRYIMNPQSLDVPPEQVFEDIY